VLANSVLTRLDDDEGRPRAVLVVTLDLTERTQMREALRESAEQYRSVYGSLDQGFCVIEMILDENGRPVDYRFLEVNPSFEGQTGLPDPVGRTARELVPDLDASWVNLYGAVALTFSPRAYRFIMSLVIGVPSSKELASTTRPYRKSADDHRTIQLHHVSGRHRAHDVQHAMASRGPGTTTRCSRACGRP
jgi:PAS domain-containing protein